MVPESGTPRELGMLAVLARAEQVRADPWDVDEVGLHSFTSYLLLQTSNYVVYLRFMTFFFVRS